ncbi:MAG: zinc ribbon domain-containing protein [Clostridia bacterium]|nr:zinc ribbon domain-containing protein [Clostridia bacterium]
MYCTKCGSEIQLGSTFCVNCGAPTPGKPISQVQNPQPSQTTRKSKPFYIIGATVAGLLFLVLVLSWLLKSPESLLVDNTWYSEPYYYRGNSQRRGETLVFYSDGTAKERRGYFYYDDDIEKSCWQPNDSDSYKWQVLDNNVLYIDGHYYEWKTEWYISRFQLRIGEVNGDNTRIYTTTDSLGYEDDE